jgi:hypothetical protein
MVCKNLGFRKYPVAKFQEIDIKDEVQLQRVATRLIELGILTPDQGINAIKTGIYPSSEDMETAQKEYTDQREDGWWNPLVGGIPAVEAPGAEEERDLKEKISKQKPPAPPPGAQPQQPGVPNQVGRPSGTSGVPQENKRTASILYSKEDIKNTIYATEKLKGYIKEELKSKQDIKRLSKKHSVLIDALCENIILSSETSEWENAASACINDFDQMEKLIPLSEVHDISAEHNLTLYPSAILYHSREK